MILDLSLATVNWFHDYTSGVPKNNRDIINMRVTVPVMCKLVSTFNDTDINIV